MAERGAPARARQVRARGRARHAAA